MIGKTRDPDMEGGDNEWILSNSLISDFLNHLVWANSGGPHLPIKSQQNAILYDNEETSPSEGNRCLSQDLLLPPILSTTPRIRANSQHKPVRDMLDVKQRRDSSCKM